MRTNKKYQRQASLLRRIPGYYKIPFFLFFLAIFSVSSLRAQELFTTGLYTNNIFTINPSFAAESDTTRVALSIYGQGNSIQDARGYCLAMHVPLHERVYVGVNVVRENYDPIANTVVGLTFAYKLSLSKRKFLSFALTPNLERTTVSDLVTKVNPYVDLTDPLLQDGEFTELNFDLGFSSMLSAYNFQAGINLPGFLDQRLPLIGNGSVFLVYDKRPKAVHRRKQKGFVVGGGGFTQHKEKEWHVVPSLYYKISPLGFHFLEFNCAAEWRGSWWIQPSYQVHSMAHLAFGFRYHDFVFGYSFGFPVSDQHGIADGRYGLLLSYNP